MLDAIVGAAFVAMNSSLNLRNLMIFIHADHKGEAHCQPKKKREFEKLFRTFQDLKFKYEASNQQKSAPGVGLLWVLGSKLQRP